MTDVDYGDLASDSSLEDVPEDGGVDLASDVNVDAAAETQMTDSLQIGDAISTLGSMQEIQPGNWEQLEAGERLQALQNIENQMSTIQERPAVDVVAQEMAPNVFGYFDGQAININSADLQGESMPVGEFVDTVIHEGRHAYQTYAVENPGVVADSELVAAWADNLAPGNYLTADIYGQEIYQNQPVEADAWHYASQIRQGLNL